MEKEFNLVEVLKETAEAFDKDAVASVAKKSFAKDLICFIEKNNLKVIQVVEDKKETEANA